jgi:cobalt-zinc-cadmium efflux system protein
MHQHSENCDHHHHSLNINEVSQRKIRLLLIALSLTFIFSLTEIWVSFISNSLALFAEASHLISDSFSLGIAIFATWIAQKDKKLSLGENQNHPAEIIAAFINALGLIILSVWIVIQAIDRIDQPDLDILSLPMLITAMVGLGINVINILLLHRDSNDDLNLKGAFLHIMADAISSIGVILAAIALGFWGWYWADWGISLFVAGLILISAIPLIIQSFKQWINYQSSEEKALQ